MKFVQKALTACVATFAAIVFPAQANADADAANSYPNRPVRIVVPYAAGGGADQIARILAISLSKSWNQPVIVENKPGASATIAGSFVAKSTPDG